ncbi:MAG: holo-ACP synthase [Pseudomonadota bacterium]
MIIGIGNDLVDIRRIEQSLKRFGQRFENKIFTQGEIAKAKQKSSPKAQAATFAKRFAAKEACAKALGVGLGKISWQEIEVANDQLGKPSLQLSGNAALHLQNLAAGKSTSIHLSLSDEYPYAQAFVIIECVDFPEQSS